MRSIGPLLTAHELESQKIITRRCSVNAWFSPPPMDSAALSLAISQKVLTRMESPRKRHLHSALGLASDLIPSTHTMARLRDM